MKEITTYSKDGLKNIENTNFLNQDDLKDLYKMASELQEDFEKKQIYRTETEMKVSVLNDVKFPTKASKYWQAVRESSVFFEQLVYLSFEYRKNDVEIRKLKKKIAKEKDEDEKELLQIELEEKSFSKKNMQVVAKDRMRELKLWSKIKKDLNDGSFNINDVNEHQLVSYAQRFIQENLISGNTGSPSERQNQVGLLDMALKESKKRGVFDKVIEGLPKEIVEQISNKWDTKKLS